MKQKKYLFLLIIFQLIFLSCNQKNSALRIKADQKDAEVYLNGKKVGNVPLDIMLSSGTYFVEVIKENDDVESYFHYYYKDNITIASDVVSTIKADLQYEIIKDKDFWIKANTINKLSFYFDYLKKYPEGKYKEKVSNKIWDLIKESNNMDKYFKFYRASKNSKSGNKALNKLIAIKAKIKKNTFIDKRNNKTYKTVIINGQEWFAENFNYSTDNTRYYPDHPEYGLVYTWKSAIKLAPNGWHLPSDAEWQQLEMYLGMSKTDANSEGDDRSGYVATILTTDFYEEKELNNIIGFNIMNDFYHSVRYWTSTPIRKEIYTRAFFSTYEGTHKDGSSCSGCATGIGRYSEAIDNNYYFVRYVKD